MPGTLSNPMSLDEQGAITSVLASSGKRSLSQSSAAAEDVKRLLHDELVTLQMSNVFFSLMVDIKLVPNASSEILLPDNLLSITRSGRTSKMIVERGTRLFDMSENTFKFTDPVYVDMRLGVAFDESPAQVRRYVTAKAAVIYLDSEEPGSASLPRLNRELISARDIFEGFDAALSPYPSKMRNSHLYELRGHSL